MSRSAELHLGPNYLRFPEPGMACLLPEISRTFLVRSTSRPCPQQSSPLCLRCSQSLFSSPLLLTLASSCHHPVCRRTHGLSAQWSSTGPSARASSPYFCLPTSRSSQPPSHHPPTPTPPPHTVTDAQLMPCHPCRSLQSKSKNLGSTVKCTEQRNWGWRRSINKSVQRVSFCIFPV